jgi:hypothetical protein
MNKETWCGFTVFGVDDVGLECQTYQNMKMLAAYTVNYARGKLFDKMEEHDFFCYRLSSCIKNTYVAMFA